MKSEVLQAVKVAKVMRCSASILRTSYPVNEF